MLQMQYTNNIIEKITQIIETNSNNQTGQRIIDHLQLTKSSSFKKIMISEANRMIQKNKLIAFEAVVQGLFIQFLLSRKEMRRRAEGIVKNKTRGTLVIAQAKIIKMTIKVIKDHKISNRALIRQFFKGDLQTLIVHLIAW